MILYADDEQRRMRQVVTDVAVAAWILLWAWVGLRVHDLVDDLAGPGRSLESAGQAFERGGGRLPLVGGVVEDAGEALARAGTAQQDAVGEVALVLALVVALVPTVWLLAHWLPGRVRWIREATAARRLLADGVDARLFALRALATAPLPALAAVAGDPLAAYERGEVDALAALELERLGLRAGGGGLPVSGPRL